MAGNDDVIPFSRFRAAVARPRGTKRIDALLSAADPAAAVAALSIPDFYFLVKEVGFADALELIELSTPQQICGCLDLDAWDRDRFELEATIPWLAVLVDAGMDKITEVWRELDPELGPLILQRLCDIYDKNLDESVPEDEERPAFATPDTFFTIVLTSERDTEIALTHRLIDFLYRGDQVMVRHSLMAAHSEPLSQLEEHSYRWRSGRMADLGYVDFHEALEVFRPLDPDKLLVEDGDTRQPDREHVPHLPTPVAEQVVGRAFLARTLSAIASSEATDRIEAELLYLVNRVLAAARVSPGNEEAVKIGARHAAATLSLGLEYVSGGEVEKAQQILTKVPLIRLHRIGHTLTLRLARTARAMAKLAKNAGPRATAVLQAVLAARPFFPTVLDPGGVEGMRPFESRVDLSVVAQELSRLALRLAAARALAEVNDGTDLDQPARTALARAVAGGDLLAAPLTQEELGKFRGMLERGKIPDVLRARAANQFDLALKQRGADEGRDLLPGLIEGWFGELEAELGNIPAGDKIDPRFVTAVAIRP